MYSHCLFCNADLGRNEALEAFPVGRRLAYDAEKGRLWVVCGGCRRWNLTPLEERWEAIEQAERLYRGTRLRASTDHVGLARVADGVDLVRIGRSIGPELAVWRYGPLLARRRRVAIAKAVTKEVAFTALEFGLLGPVAAVTRALIRLNARDRESYWTGEEETAAPLLARVPMRIGGVTLRVDVDLATVRIQLSSDGEPTVTVPYGRGTRVLSAHDAGRALRPMLVRLNNVGAPAEQVGRATNRLVRAGGASAYLAQLGTRRSLGATRRVAASDEHRDGGAHSAAATGDGFALHRLSRFDRLAFEMAVHDTQERRAMDGELAELERAWRDAEEIAGIADGLALPRSVDDAWQRLRAARDA